MCKGQHHSCSRAAAAATATMSSNTTVKRWWLCICTKAGPVRIELRRLLWLLMRHVLPLLHMLLRCILVFVLLVLLVLRWLVLRWLRWGRRIVVSCTCSRRDARGNFDLELVRIQSGNL